jgi:hypothetical protein
MLRFVLRSGSKKSWIITRKNPSVHIQCGRNKHELTSMIARVPMRPNARHSPGSSCGTARYRMGNGCSSLPIQRYLLGVAVWASKTEVEVALICQRRT